MGDTATFREAVLAWAAGGAGADAAAGVARSLAGSIRSVVLVEGVSDQAAIEALAARLGRALPDEGVGLVPMGGATSIRRYVDLLGPHGLGLRLAGLCDAGEEQYFVRAVAAAGLMAAVDTADLAAAVEDAGLAAVVEGPRLSRPAMESLGFFVCEADLEDELIRALGVEAVERVLDRQGDLRVFRTFQKQPAQRPRTVEHQLRRFMGTISGRKEQYGRALVEALELDSVPRPLRLLLECV